MNGRLSIAASLAALMLSSSAVGDDDFHFYRLDASLRTVQTARWKAGAPIAGPVHVSPAGDVVAILAPVRAPLQLVRWDGRTGREFSRRPLDLTAPVRTSRLTGDALVVVTDDEVAHVDLKDGRVVARVAVGTRVGDAAVAASPHGAWIAFPDHLLHVRLDGTRVTRAAPVGVPPGPDNGLAFLLVTERDECVVAERRSAYHAVSGRDATPDRTSELVLTFLAARGDVLAQATRGQARTRREWFWSEGSTEGPLPRGFGIVRTRHYGSVFVEALAERANGGFVLVTLEDVGAGEPRRQVSALDHDLRERWAVSVGAMDARGLAPAGPNGILFRSGIAQVRRFDEETGAEQVGHLPYPEGVAPLDLAGTALGRNADGGWIVVAYAPGTRR